MLQTHRGALLLRPSLCSAEKPVVPQTKPTTWVRCTLRQFFCSLSAGLESSWHTMGLKCLNLPSASCSAQICPCVGVKVVSRYTLPDSYIPNTKESSRWNHALVAEFKILTLKKQNGVCLLSKLINTGKQIYQPYAWYLYLLIDSVNQKHNAFHNLWSPALTAKDGKIVELKKKERFGVGFGAKPFQKWASKGPQWLQSGNVAWPSWCIRFFTHLLLLCFLLSYSWYTNLGKELESKKNDIFLPEIIKCKEILK